MIEPFKDPEKEKEWQKFREHFPIEGDIELMILKGHLLAEEEINSMIEKFANNIKYLHEAQLTFFQKICLLRALLPKVLHQSLYSAEMLNRLRNKIAHSLEPKGLEDSINNFLISIDQEYKPSTSPELIRKKLIGCLARMHSGLSGYKSALSKMTFSHIL